MNIVLKDNNLTKSIDIFQTPQTLRSNSQIYKSNKRDNKRINYSSSPNPKVKAKEVYVERIEKSNSFNPDRFSRRKIIKELSDDLNDSFTRDDYSVTESAQGSVNKYYGIVYLNKLPI